MIKSIYEEVLKRMNVEFDAWDRAERFGLFELIEQALEKAQNQEKLLELYRCLDENANDYDLHYDKVDEIHNKIDEIEERIKELENDI